MKSQYLINDWLQFFVALYCLEFSLKKAMSGVKSNTFWCRKIKMCHKNKKNVYFSACDK